MTEYELQKLTFVPKELKLRIENIVLECLDKAQAKFGVDKCTKIPEIRYNTKGRTAGWACWNGGKPYIDINPILLRENVEEVVNQTVPHEVAHIVVNEVYENARVRDMWTRRRQVAPHGVEWQQVMRLFGKVPHRCHQMDTSTVQALRNGGREFHYKCNCQVHKMTIIKHNRISIHGMAYICRRCRSEIKFDKVVEVV